MNRLDNPKVRDHKQITCSLDEESYRTLQYLVQSHNLAHSQPRGPVPSADIGSEGSSNLHCGSPSLSQSLPRRAFCCSVPRPLCGNRPQVHPVPQCFTRLESELVLLIDGDGLIRPRIAVMPLSQVS